ncbi:MAG: TlpA family protein disulfide reductase [Nannocystaceae bacterium]|nr:TlpA family protein disulfide reductase [Nannocystaceae bacterium]
MARVWPTLVFVALAQACGPASVTPQSTVAPEPAAPVRTEILGDVRAYDGSALAAGAYRVIRNGMIEPAVQGPLDPEGHFRVALEPGVYWLGISGVDHLEQWQALWVDGPVRVYGSLGTPERADAAPWQTHPIAIELQYLDAAGVVLAQHRLPGTRRNDGVEHFALPAIPEGATVMRHRVLSSHASAPLGSGERWQNDGHGRFWTVTAPQGPGSLELDLRDPPPPAIAATVAWDSVDIELDSAQRTAAQWRRARAKAASEGRPQADHPVTAAELAAAWRNVEQEPRSEQRWLVLAFLDGWGPLAGDAQLARAVAWMLDEIAPQDARIALFADLHMPLLRVLIAGEPALAERLRQWLDRRARDNADVGERVAALALLLEDASARGDQAAVTALYRRLDTPAQRATVLAGSLAARFDPERPLQLGRTLPAFDFEAVGPAAARVRSDERRGLQLLIVWATWCQPCLDELPALHAAWAAIHGVTPPRDGDWSRVAPLADPAIEFVSISLDDSPQTVAAARRGRLAMPWTHAFVGVDRADALEREFGFVGVPTLILVDRAGTILALDDALVGEALLPTLQAALRDHPAARPRRTSP